MDLHRKMSFSKFGIIVTGVILLGYAADAVNLSIPEAWKAEVHQRVGETAADMLLPGLTFPRKQKWNLRDWTRMSALRILPLGSFVEGKGVYATETEDEETYRMILLQQANEETEADAKQEAQADVPETGGAMIDMSAARLQDFGYLIQNFYTVDRTTAIGPEQLNAASLLARDMKLQGKADGPKVLIFHTHSQETFADSAPQDAGTSIVGIGAYLAELLNAKGIETIHHEGVYDLINGKLDRSSAYEFAEAGVRKILAENPTIEVVIDLHRDGVREDRHLVTEINGKQTAQIMFFNGLSRTKANGDIAYLPNPYIQDNLAFSLQMQLAGERMYPGFLRHIYLKAYRYSLHMMPKSLLIEAGAQTNTVEEMRNAMEVLASMLHKVLI